MMTLDKMVNQIQSQLTQQQSSVSMVKSMLHVMMCLSIDNEIYSYSYGFNRLYEMSSFESLLCLVRIISIGFD